MALYMTQFAYTADAWKALTRSPEDRREAIGALAQRLGGRLVSLYYAFGEYDGVVISDMPDDVSAAALAIAAAAPGHLKAMRTTRLLTVEETLEALRRAGAAGFQGPAG
ncbi:MAG: GYD domain-containing protein [Chloroflexi bacterium]|jgi:uncharacterized protein with GYD domain|nr:GYD domain-containing protein [Chloroflexota bacterium]